MSSCPVVRGGEERGDTPVLLDHDNLSCFLDLLTSRLLVQRPDSQLRRQMSFPGLGCQNEGMLLQRSTTTALEAALVIPEYDQRRQRL